LGFGQKLVNYSFNLEFSSTFSNAQMTALGVLIATNENWMYFFPSMRK